MKIGWIARDIDKSLRVYYGSKPFLINNDGEWDNEESLYIDLPPDSFPEVTFENSPQQVEIKLVK